MKYLFLFLISLITLPSLFAQTDTIVVDVNTVYGNIGEMATVTLNLSYVDAGTYLVVSTVKGKPLSDGYMKNIMSTNMPNTIDGFIAEKVIVSENRIPQWDNSIVIYLPNPVSNLKIKQKVSALTSLNQFGLNIPYNFYLGYITMHKID